MKIIKFAASALAVVIVGVASFASAQPLGRHDPRLSAVWTEREGVWQGTWTPASPTQMNGAYTASFYQNMQPRVNSRLQITIFGNLTSIVRTEANGQHCNYRGTFNADGNTVSGTYTCDWHRASLPWSAQIGARNPAASEDRSPYLTTPRLLLAFPWSEQEGAWRGQWTPVAPRSTDGHYSAHFVHETESASADLQISISGGTSRVVTVRRADPTGRTCNYVGQVGADFSTVSGTYICTDQPRLRLPWGAHIQLPQQH